MLGHTPDRPILILESRLRSLLLTSIYCRLDMELLLLKIHDIECAGFPFTFACKLQIYCQIIYIYTIHAHVVSNLD